MLLLRRDLVDKVREDERGFFEFQVPNVAWLTFGEITGMRELVGFNSAVKIPFDKILSSKFNSAEFLKHAYQTPINIKEIYNRLGYEIDAELIEKLEISINKATAKLVELMKDVYRNFPQKKADLKKSLHESTVKVKSFEDYARLLLKVLPYSYQNLTAIMRTLKIPDVYQHEFSQKFLRYEQSVVDSMDSIRGIIGDILIDIDNGKIDEPSHFDKNVEVPEPASGMAMSVEDFDWENRLKVSTDFMDIWLLNIDDLDKSYLNFLKRYFKRLLESLYEIQLLIEKTLDLKANKFSKQKSELKKQLERYVKIYEDSSKYTIEISSVDDFKNFVKMCVEDEMYTHETLVGFDIVENTVAEHFGLKSQSKIDFSRFNALIRDVCYGLMNDAESVKPFSMFNFFQHVGMWRDENVKNSILDIRGTFNKVDVSNVIVFNERINLGYYTHWDASITNLKFLFNQANLKFDEEAIFELMINRLVEDYEYELNTRVKEQLELDKNKKFRDKKASLKSQLENY